MTTPHEDDRWVAFWRQHRPPPPPAPPGLENQIMAAITADAQRPPSARHRPWGRRQWALSAIAASLLLSWGGWVTWRSAALPTAEAAELDSFLTETWYGASYGDDTLRLALDTTEPDWVFAVYATPY